MADDFALQFKSTIDKLIADRVEILRDSYPTLQWAEVDDMAQTDEVFKSEEPAIIWQFATMEPYPRSPLYRVEFMVGVKTTLDPGNYLLIRLLGEIRNVFDAGKTLYIRDYTMLEDDPADATDKGYVLIGSNEVAPQQFDRQSGIRYAGIVGKAVRYGG